MSCSEIAGSLKELLAPLAKENGLELLELHWRPESSGWVLRLIVDKDIGNVTLKDCEMISRLSETRLDGANLVSHGYSLEVSSPGLDRPLRQPKDYRRFLGERVRLVLREKVTDGEPVGPGFVAGRISSIDAAAFLLSHEGGSSKIPFTAVERANLDPEIGPVPRIQD